MSEEPIPVFARCPLPIPPEGWGFYEWDSGEERIEPPREELTCFKCPENTTCEYAWDLYNTNGDCLALK